MKHGNENGSGVLPAEGVSTSKRLLSLDALRGFDMFWIVGGEEIAHALAKALPFLPFTLFHRQMLHSDWVGVTFYDLIFPLFVFIIGVSSVFSLRRSLETKGRAATMKHVVVRSLILYLIGLFFYGGLSHGLEGVRWLGVLQRMAICSLFAGVAFLTLRLRGLIILCASLLLGYWLLCSFVPVRDFNVEKGHLTALGLQPNTSEAIAQYHATPHRVAGKFEDGLNLPQHLDFLYLPGFKWDGGYDPEGLLSTLPAVASCLLGVFAGMFLMFGGVSKQKKVLYLAAAGAIGIVGGMVWGIQFPVIKKIWSSSYVLVAGGYSCLIVALFYQVVEVWTFRRWCTPFVWIGMNPITIYLVFEFVKFKDFAERLVGAPLQKAMGAWGEVAIAGLVVALVLALVRFLYQRKIFLKV